MPPSNRPEHLALVPVEEGGVARQQNVHDNPDTPHIHRLAEHNMQGEGGRERREQQKQSQGVMRAFHFVARPIMWPLSHSSFRGERTLLLFKYLR